MLKTCSRPNLRCRSNDLLEEERCASYRALLTYRGLEKRRASTANSANIDRSNSDLIRSNSSTSSAASSSSRGDLLIDQLVQASSLDSLQDFKGNMGCVSLDTGKEKRPEFLQLKKPRRGEKSLRTVSQDGDFFSMYNNAEYWQDFILPRGSLTTINHSFHMGPMGSVQTGLFRNKYRVALKTENVASEDLQKELILLKYLGHNPTILSCYGYVKQGPSLQIAYELAPYGSLDVVIKENKVQAFPLSLIVSWMSDLADAMQFLHSKGVVHCGIKPENILLYERLDIKLCNFRSAKSILSDSMLSETFSSLSFDQHQSPSSTPLQQQGQTTKDQQLITSYAMDITGFYNTVYRLIKGEKTCNDLMLTEKTERDKLLEDALLNRPFLEFTIASKLYFVLASFTEYEQSNHQFHRYLTITTHPLEAKLPSKQLAEQLFALLEEFCDGDPREPVNEHYKKIQRFELLIKSKIDNLVPIPPKSRLRQKLFGSSTLRKFPDGGMKNVNNPLADVPRLSTSPTSISAVANATPAQLAAMKEEGFSTQKVIDPRTTLTEWLVMDYQCSFAEAEEFSAYFLRNGINSKEGVIHMLELTPNFLHKYGSNYELAGRMKEQLLSEELRQ